MKLAGKKSFLIGSAAGLLLIIAAFATLQSVTLLRRAQSLEQDAAEMQASVNITVLLQEPGGLEALQATIATMQERVEGLGSARSGRFFGWLPFVGNDLTAASTMIKGTQEGLAVAQDLLETIGPMVAWYQENQDVLLQGEVSFAAPDTSQATLDNLNRVIEKAREAQQTLADIDPAGLGEGLASRLESLTEVTNRIADVAVWSHTVVGLLGDLAEVRDVGNRIQSSLPLNEASADEWSLDAAIQDLQQLEGSLNLAREKAGTAAQDFPGGAGQVLAQFQQIEVALTALHQVALSGLSTMATLKPAFQILEAAQFAPLQDGEGSLISAMEAVQADPKALEMAVEQLREARVSFEEASGSLPMEKGDIAQLSKLLRSLEGALRIVNDLPIEALGSDRPRTYLVLGQTADELRATGGYISALWTVTLSNGMLQDIHYFDTVEVDDYDSLWSYPRPPEPLIEHMNAPVWLMRDVSWDPDFTATAPLAEDMFWLGQRLEVDGVIALNQWTMQRLANVLGEVPSPTTGAPVPASEFMTFFEGEKTTFGRAYIDVTLRSILDTLSQPSSPARLWSLSTALFESLQSKEIMAYLNDPELQGIMEERGWAGKITSAPGDFLMVIDSNVGWSKVDRNINREVEYEIALSDQANPRVQLTLRYQNTSGPQATGCELQWMSRGRSYEEKKHACYWDYLRVFVPNGTQFLETSTLPLPVGSVAETIGVSFSGEPTHSITTQRGKTIYSGLITVGPNETRTVSLTYDLPSTIIERQGDLLIYRLHLQKQPGVLGRNIKVRVIPPAGYALTERASTTFDEEGGAATFELNLTQDTTLEINFRVKTPETIT